MDYSLIVLVGLIVASLFIATKLNSRGWPGLWLPPSVFVWGAIGLLNTMAGVIGWDLSYSHGWFQGTKWVNGPVWWQIGVGIAGLDAVGVLRSSRVAATCLTVVTER